MGKNTHFYTAVLISCQTGESLHVANEKSPESLIKVLNKKTCSKAGFKNVKVLFDEDDFEFIAVSNGDYTLAVVSVTNQDEPITEVLFVNYRSRE